ncbi:MAG: type II toxin-antitoxin system RelE/ParE family toxin [Nitrospinae bacterium]|nr:type II toxin-antitoxin system RelE/ParE family toxin [Nitrospinota bacterium]
MDWEVKYYRTQAGREPAAEFIDSLSDEDVAKVFRTIGLLVGRGVMLKEPYSRQINGKMRELRISCNREEVRIFFCRFPKDVSFASRVC